MMLRQSDSSSPESGFRRTNPSPNMRQKRGERSRVTLDSNPNKLFSNKHLPLPPGLSEINCRWDIKCEAFRFPKSASGRELKRRVQTETERIEVLRKITCF